ncbi:MAG TPA: SpoIIE family protein phosphatase [Egibacteraceae bacterium]|nr:SpoIIE family protein phosphatase [Egibacteraceae bacterium]
MTIPAVSDETPRPEVADPRAADGVRTQARYRALVEATALDVWHADAAGALVRDMPNWRAITGQRPGDVLGEGWQLAIHPDDVERVRATWQLAVATRSIYECEYRIVARDGSHRVIHARGVPVVEDGELVEWVGTSEDVTDDREEERYTREQARAVERLSEIGTTLSAELDVRELLQTITDATTELSGAQFGAFFYSEVRQDDGVEQEQFALYTVSGVPLEKFSRFPMPRNTAIFAPTFAGEGPVRLDDVTQDARYGRNPPYHGMPEGHLPVRSYLAVPVVSKSGHVHGGLFFGHELPGVFNARHERLVVSVAAQAAAALDNAQLYEAERRSRAAAEQAQRDLAFLARANYALGASLDFHKSAEVVTKLPVPDLCDWAVLHVVSEGGDVEAVSLYHRDEARRQLLRELAGRFPVRLDEERGPAVALRTGQTYVLEAIDDAALDAHARDDRHREALDQAGIGAMLSVPILTRDRVVGSLSFVRERSRSFTDREVVLAEELTSRAGLALDSAMLFSRERAAALTLQRSLLPGALPAVEGTVCAVRYLPGAAGMEVGGDWYDVIPLGEGVVAYVVGDVMGRGVQAAGVMGQIRSAVRAYALEDHPPEEVLARVDRLLRLAEEPPLVTCVYARLDTRSGELCLSTAGHLPPLVVSPLGESRYLELEPGLPLGVAETTFASGCLTLERGSTLVLYTDGLVETPQSSVTAGMEALRACAVEYAVEGDIEAFIDALISALERGDGHDDDIAVLAVRLPEATEVLPADAPAGRAVGRTLPPDASSVGKARAFLHETLAAWDVPVDIDDAKLLVSELVTNALVHAGTVVHLHVEAREDALRVAVGDEGPPDREVPTGGELPDLRMAVGGRGLAIVSVLAHRWGVDPLPDGKRVWFELGFAQ